MIKKLSKIISLLIAVAITVLSIVMLVPVEAKAVDNTPYISRQSDGWKFAPNSTTPWGAQSSGSFTVDLTGSMEDTFVCVKNETAGITIHVHFYNGMSTRDISYSNSNACDKVDFMMAGLSGTITVYWEASGDDLYFTLSNDNAPATSVAPGHVHNFVWGTIIEPTIDHDGLEGEACSCGATRNTQPISAYAYAMEQYAYNKVANTGAGNTCVLEMGTMDTYPKRFMEAIAPSVLRGVTVELRFKSNQKLTKIQIPGGSVVDTSCDWYGVNKLKELYTEIQ